MLKLKYKKLNYLFKTILQSVNVVKNKYTDNYL